MSSRASLFYYIFLGAQHHVKYDKFKLQLKCLSFHHIIVAIVQLFFDDYEL